MIVMASIDEIVHSILALSVKARENLLDMLAQEICFGCGRDTGPGVTCDCAAAQDWEHAKENQ